MLLADQGRFGYLTQQTSRSDASQIQSYYSRRRIMMPPKLHVTILDHDPNFGPDTTKLLAHGTDRLMSKAKPDLEPKRAAQQLLV